MTENITLINRIEITVLYLDTSKLHFRHLKPVDFLKLEIISLKVQKHALGRLAANLIDGKTQKIL